MTILKDYRTAREFFKKAFPKEEIKSCKTLKKGTTNRLFFINDHYVVRLKKPLEKELFNAEEEQKDLSFLFKNDLGPKPCAFSNNGNYIIQYLANTELTKDDYPSIARALKKLHSLKLETTSFNPIKRLDLYKMDEEYPPLLKELIPLIEHYTKDNLVLCHNDLLLANILKTEDGIKFIDYEYMALNHPYFDLASFISENVLSKEEAKLFLESYFEKPLTKDQIILLKQFIAFEDYLWGYWAKKNYFFTKKKVYKDIYEDKKAAQEIDEEYFDKHPEALKLIEGLTA